MTDENATPLPVLPCGHRTKHTQRIGCCSGCKELFSSDSAFARHRKDSKCLTPGNCMLETRRSKSAPDEWIWSLPSNGHKWGDA